MITAKQRERIEHRLFIANRRKGDDMWAYSYRQDILLLMKEIERLKLRAKRKV